MLTKLEQDVVDLTERGFARWKIAEELKVTERTVRAVIARLCQRFDCNMRELPDAVRKEKESATGSPSNLGGDEAGDPGESQGDR